MRFDKDLQLGSMGLEVYSLQEFLEDYGYEDFVPTGYFGTKTWNAVQMFQRDNGVDLSMGGVGRFGPKTRAVANRLIQTAEQIYTVAVAYLSKDPTPEDKIPDEYACAEVVSKILEKAGYGIGYYPLTTDMYHALLRSPDWIASEKPIAGSVIISPTGYGNGKLANGHVGICGYNQVVMSNSSASGLWDENYTVSSWKDRYVKRGGFPCVFFRHR